MVVSFKAPSKTFLIGEYVALDGGPSLILNTKPYFEFVVRKNGQGQCAGIHPLSPAGKYLRDHNYLFQKIDVEFKDPHLNKGGLGASSSQFLFVYFWQQLLGGELLQSNRELMVEKLWQEFKKYSWDGEGRAPSGADIVSQFMGNMSLFSTEDSFIAQSIKWPFADKGFSIVRTGNKLATHEHLKSTNFSSSNNLKKSSLNCIEALKDFNWPQFCKSINDFSIGLREQNLTCESSLELLTQFSNLEFIDALKPCGAMGADTLLIFYGQENRNKVQEIISSLGLEVAATEADLCGGFEANLDFTEVRAHV